MILHELMTQNGSGKDQIVLLYSMSHGDGPYIMHGDRNIKCTYLNVNIDVQVMNESPSPQTFNSDHNVLYIIKSDRSGCVDDTVQMSTLYGLAVLRG